MKGLKVGLRDAVVTAPFLAHPGEDEGKFAACQADLVARSFPGGERRDVCLLGDLAADLTFVQAPLTCILEDPENPAKQLGVILALSVEVSIRLCFAAKQATFTQVAALVWCERVSASAGETDRWVGGWRG